MNINVSEKSNSLMAQGQRGFWGGAKQRIVNICVPVNFENKI